MSREMKNVKLAVEGDELVIRVDMKQNFGRSGKDKDGATNVIASSAGFAPIPGFEKTWISLNVNTKQGL